tara:strand:- start:279 stop:509 length:231 start_codon:yes stop_codon:yes gene_type:complete
VRHSKKLRYRGGPSEILDSVIFSDYEIKSLKHGNTGHVLFKYPSKAYDWEDCWTMDLQTAKNNVLKYQQRSEEEEE